MGLLKDTAELQSRFTFQFVVEHPGANGRGTVHIINKVDFCVYGKILHFLVSLPATIFGRHFENVRDRISRDRDHFINCKAAFLNCVPSGYPSPLSHFIESQNLGWLVLQIYEYFLVF